MKYFIDLSILGTVVAIFSLLITRILIYLMPKLGIVDIPSSRRMHIHKTPRGGGVGLVLILSIFLPIFEYITQGSYSESMWLLQILLPISFISFYDDISHVFIPLRLITHILCSLLAIMWLIHPNTILPYQIPMILDLVISSFALLTFLNIYNFLDGIDGITASQSIHLSIVILLLCFLQYDITPNVDMVITIATIILSWSLGFIYFNWQPAQIFLGDVGSVTIGFLLGICLLTVASASIESFTACVIASLYYIADGGITLLTRLLNREKIWEAHLQHFFQKSVKTGKTHKRVVKRIIKCNIFLMIFSISSLYYPVISIICGLITIITTLIRSIT